MATKKIPKLKKSNLDPTEAVQLALQQAKAILKDKGAVELAMPFVKAADTAQKREALIASVLTPTKEMVREMEQLRATATPNEQAMKQFVFSDAQPVTVSVEIAKGTFVEESYQAALRCIYFPLLGLFSGTAGELPNKSAKRDKVLKAIRRAAPPPRALTDTDLELIKQCFDDAHFDLDWAPSTDNSFCEHLEVFNRSFLARLVLSDIPKAALDDRAALMQFLKKKFAETTGRDAETKLFEELSRKILNDNLRTVEAVRLVDAVFEGLLSADVRRALQTRARVSSGASFVAAEVSTRRRMADRHPFYSRDAWETDEEFAEWQRRNDKETAELLALPSIALASAKGTVQPIGALHVKVWGATELITKKGKSIDPFCVLTFGSDTSDKQTGRKSFSEMRKTSTASSTASPVWGEEFVLEVLPWQPTAPPMLEVAVFDYRKLRKNTFLGRVVLPWQQLQTQVSSGRQALRLEPKKEKQAKPVSGSLTLEWWFVPNAVANASEIPPNAPKMFKFLFKKLTEYENRLNVSTSGDTTATAMQLPSTLASWIMDEFAKRYGVGDVWRQLTLADFLLWNIRPIPAHLEVCHSALEELAFLRNIDKVPFTKKERALWTKLRARAREYTTAQLSHFKKYFPFSAPAGVISKLVEIHQLAQEVDDTAARQTAFADLEKIVRLGIAETYSELLSNAKATVTRLLAENAASQVSPKGTVAPRDSNTPKQIVHLNNSLELQELSEKLREEIRVDIQFFAPDFGEFPFTEIALATYAELYAADVERYFSEFQGNPTADLPVFELYFCTRDFFRLVGRRIPNNPTVKEFVPKLQRLVFPHIDAWMASSSLKLQEWLKNAIAFDTWAPLSIDDKLLHSTSVGDLFTGLYASLEFLQKLNWPERGGEWGIEALLRRFLSLVTRLSNQYVDALWRACIDVDIAKSMAASSTTPSAESPKKQKPHPNIITIFHPQKQQPIGAISEREMPTTIVSPRLCVRINDMEICSKFAAEMGKTIDEYLHATLKVESGADFSESTLRSLFRDVTNRVSDVIHRTAETIEPTVRAYFRKVFIENGCLFKVLCGLSKSPRVDTKTPISEQLVPMLDYLDEQLLVANRYMYLTSFNALLNASWSATSRALRSVIVPDTPKKILHQDQIALVKTVFPPLEEFFYGDGDGLSKERLGKDITVLMSLLDIYLEPSSKLIARFEAKNESQLEEDRALRDLILCLLAVRAQTWNDFEAKKFVQRQQSATENYAKLKGAWIVKAVLAGSEAKPAE